MKKWLLGIVLILTIGIADVIFRQYVDPATKAHLALNAVNGGAEDAAALRVYLYIFPGALLMMGVGLIAWGIYALVSRRNTHENTNR